MEHYVNIYFDVDFERQSSIRERGGCHEVTGGAPFQPASMYFRSHHRCGGPPPPRADEAFGCLLRYLVNIPILTYWRCVRPYASIIHKESDFVS